MDDDLLPYAQRGDTLPPPYPEYSLGFTVSGYFPELDGLSPAFTAIEEEYRDEGYDIRYHKPGFNLGPVIWSSYAVRWSRPLSTLVQAGTTIYSDVDLGAFSATIMYHLPTIGSTPIEPFVALGGGFYAFSAVREYNEALYSEGFLPGYTQYLENISARGSTLGLTMSGGFQITSPWGSRGGVSVGYLHAPEMVIEEDGEALAKIEPASILARFQVLFHVW